MQTQDNLPARDPAPPPGRQTLLRPTLDSVLAAVPGSRPADPPAPSKRHRILTLVALLPALWLAFSALVFPFDPVGHTAVAWSETLGFVLLAATAARAYQPAVTGRAAIILFLGSVALVVGTLVHGFRETAPVVWWNFLLAGSSLTVLSLAGLVLVRREHRERTRRRARGLFRAGRRARG